LSRRILFGSGIMEAKRQPGFTETSKLELQGRRLKRGTPSPQRLSRR